MVNQVSGSKSLSDYKRREKVFITLPSKTMMPYPPGYISLSPSGELGIRPMATADQITLSNPEALISGDASIKIIQSCVPGVLDPGILYAPDLDAIYAGIRLATYGENTELELECPECKKYHAFDMPIRYSLENIIFLPEDPNVIIDVDGSNGDEHLCVHLRPYTLLEATQEANIKFQQAKAAQTLFSDESNLDDDIKNSEFYKTLQEIANETVKLVAQCITKIEAQETGDDFDLSDRELVLDWLNNLPAKEAEKITQLVAKLNTEYGIKKGVEIECDGCHHVWTANISFDPTSFFV